jgi:hypothetical protein
MLFPHPAFRTCCEGRCVQDISTNRMQNMLWGGSSRTFRRVAKPPLYSLAFLFPFTASYSLPLTPSPNTYHNAHPATRPRPCFSRALTPKDITLRQQLALGRCDMLNAIPGGALLCLMTNYTGKCLVYRPGDLPCLDFETTAPWIVRSDRLRSFALGPQSVYEDSYCRSGVGAED